MRLFQTILTVFSVIIPSMIALYAIWQMKKTANRIPSFDDFFEIETDKEGKETVMVDKRIALVLDSLASRFFQSAKMSALQSIGVNAKLDKGLKGAFAKDIVDKQIPWLTLLDHFAGTNVKEYIAKNPDAMLSLLNNPNVQDIIGRFTNRQNNGNFMQRQTVGRM